MIYRSEIEETQIETHHVHGGGPTHGTEGPLAVSSSRFMTDLTNQFLQTGRTLDPDRAQEADDADSNDLKTINFYTVGVSPSNM